MSWLKSWFGRSTASGSAEALTDAQRGLLATVESIIEVLEDDGETHWQTYMAEVRAMFLRGDRRAVQKLLGAYGGMGSFNDLVLGHRVVDGETVVRDDMAALNERLDGLRTSAWTQAKELAEDR